MIQQWRWLCVEDEICKTCHGWTQPLLLFSLLMRPQQKNNWFKQKGHWVPKPCNDCVHSWGWVPDTVSHLLSNSWGVSINFGRIGKTLLQKTLEADHSGVREEMPVRYWWKRRSQSRAGGQSWVSAMCQKKEQIMPQVLLGPRVPPLLHVPVWIVGPAASGSEEPKSTPWVSLFKAPLLRQWVSILLRQ